MEIVTSKNNVPVRLTDERWSHIESNHPEMRLHRVQVLETIGEPDFVQEGDFGVLLAVRQYQQAPLAGKHVLVAYRELGNTDGFVLTAYVTRRPSVRRRVPWQR